MIDIENVIKALECCLKESDHLYSNPCNGCPYEGRECIDRMKTDALALLKEYKSEYENGFNDAMLGKQELMYEGVDGKWHKKDW